MQLLLIEGIPGSGKSTLAKLICQSALDRGIDAFWYLEEAQDHPLHPHKGTRGEISPEVFLNQWRQFIAQHSQHDHLYILEGSLFQSSVRFLLQENRETDIPDYYAECEKLLSSVESKAIYLRPSDVQQHLVWLYDHRGHSWTTKVSGYLENTPFSADRGWLGVSGMSQFWGYYASLCDRLIRSSCLSVKTIESGTAHYDSLHQQALDWLELSPILDKVER